MDPENFLICKLRLIFSLSSMKLLIEKYWEILLTKKRAKIIWPEQVQTKIDKPANHMMMKR